MYSNICSHQRPHQVCIRRRRRRRQCRHMFSVIIWANICDPSSRTLSTYGRIGMGINAHDVRKSNNWDGIVSTTRISFDVRIRFIYVVLSITTPDTYLSLRARSIFAAYFPRVPRIPIIGNLVSIDTKHDQPQRMRTHRHIPLLRGFNQLFHENVCPSDAVVGRICIRERTHFVHPHQSATRIRHPCPHCQ